MSPRFVNREQKKRDIALASLPLFAKGFESTNIDQIAKSAKIGKGTVYEYFDSKDDIFITAVEVWITQANNDIKNILKDIDSPVDSLKTFVETITTMFSPTNPEVVGLFSTIQQQALSKNGVYYNNRGEISRLCNGCILIISDILLDGIAKGVFRPDIARDVNIISRNMLSYLDGIGLWSALLPKDEFNYTSHVEHFFKIYLEMIKK